MGLDRSPPFRASVGRPFTGVSNWASWFESVPLGSLEHLFNDWPNQDPGNTDRGALAGRGATALAGGHEGLGACILTRRYWSHTRRGQ
jgi:hypothetical protein